MSKLKLNTLVLGIVQTNCYIVSNEETGEAIVIDPADKAPQIIKHLKDNDLVCKAILLTHGHFDHIMATAELAATTAAKIYAHEAEAALLADPNLNASIKFRRECSLTVDELIKDKAEPYLAGFKIKVIHTPGHTAGGVCYYFEEHDVLFSGDTLFAGDIGRSDLPTGNGRQLVESIKTKLMPLKDEVIVYPGHEEASSIGRERRENMYISSNLFD